MFFPRLHLHRSPAPLFGGAPGPATPVAVHRFVNPSALYDPAPNGYSHVAIAEGALLQILMPLATAVGGAVFFREHFFPHELLGAGLILAGSAFIAVRRSS